ncbi:MAG TPA: hypothetical protein VGR01_19575 [Burkholderiales bacterium]|jgi:hypothetical protein|nr:hypothetical protein [Burkholderiales bacterium]
MRLLLLLTCLVPATALALDNDYVRVTRNSVTCPQASMPGCGERVIVALDDMEIFVGYAKRNLARGEIIVFERERAFPPPVGEFFEVVIKPDHPPVLSPPEIIPPEKNAMLWEGEHFFVFEEKLAPGDTRARHSHSQRVVIQLNKTRLQQWPDGEPEKFVEIPVEQPSFSPPVIHVVKNVGDAPLLGIVIEFKPQKK